MADAGCGVAAAFKSPISATVLIIEEISSFFNKAHATHVFVACVFAYHMVSMLGAATGETASAVFQLSAPYAHCTSFLIVEFLSTSHTMCTQRSPRKFTVSVRAGRSYAPFDPDPVVGSRCAEPRRRSQSVLALVDVDVLVLGDVLVLVAENVLVGLLVVLKRTNRLAELIQPASHLTNVTLDDNNIMMNNMLDSTSTLELKT